MNDKLKKLAKVLKDTQNYEESQMVIKLAEDAVTPKDILIATLIGEASVDGSEGMTAVYSVIKNRASHKGTSMSNICLEPKQFSMWNDKKSEQQRKDFVLKQKNAPGGKWPEAERIVNSDPGDTTFGSTHYYTGSTPGWASSKNPCWAFRVKVGSHTFGIDFSSSWLSNSSLPADVIKAYIQEGREPARCYIDVPKRYPPRSLKEG